MTDPRLDTSEKKLGSFGCVAHHARLANEYEHVHQRLVNEHNELLALTGTVVMVPKRKYRRPPKYKTVR